MLNGPGEVQSIIFFWKNWFVKAVDNSSAHHPPPRHSPLKRPPQLSVLNRVNKVLLRTTASVKFLRFSFLQLLLFYSKSRKFGKKFTLKVSFSIRAQNFFPTMGQTFILYIWRLCHPYFGCLLHSNKHRTVVTACNWLWITIVICR